MGPSDETSPADLPPACPIGQLFCEDDSVWRCGQDGRSRTLEEDCLAARPKPLRCTACPDGAACGRDVPPTRVKITGIENIDVSLPDGCPSDMTLSLVEAGYKSLAEHEFAFDKQHGPRMTFRYGYIFRGGYVIGVAYQSKGKTRVCQGGGDGGPMSKVKLTVTGRYTVEASGELSCDANGASWEPFTYRASWTP